jgi:hypothetical protein
MRPIIHFSSQSQRTCWIQTMTGSMSSLPPMVASSCYKNRQKWTWFRDFLAGASYYELKNGVKLGSRLEKSLKTYGYIASTRSLNDPGSGS